MLFIFNSAFRTLAVAVFVTIAFVVFCVCAGLIAFGIGIPIVIYVIGGIIETILVCWIIREFWEQYKDDEEEKELANLSRYAQKQKRMLYRGFN